MTNFEQVGLEFVGKDEGLAKEARRAQRALKVLNQELQDLVILGPQVAAVNRQASNSLVQQVNTTRLLNRNIRNSFRLQNQGATLQERLNQKRRESFDAIRQQSFALETLGRGLRDVGSVIRSTGTALTSFTTIPIAATLALSAQAAIEFETAFTGVLKTVDGLVIDGTLAELNRQGQALRQGFIDLSLEIPAAASSLAEIGEIAGQLGVAAGEIRDFTEIVFEFSESTDVASEQAAKALAQIANVFQEEDISEFADATTNSIVRLGNNFATTESEILSFLQAFAGAAASFNVSTQDALALAAAFKSVRAQTASSSTGIQKTFLAISQAVNNANEDLDLFSQVSGITAEEFVALWESRPALAFTRFIEGLRDSGAEAPLILKSLGLGDQRIIREFTKIINGADRLTQALDESADAFGNFGDAGDRAVEAARRFETVESQIQLLRNEFTALAIEIGEILLPIIRDIVNDLRPVIASVREFVDQNPELAETAIKFLAITAAVGPLVIVFGSLITTTGTLIEGISALARGIAALNFLRVGGEVSKVSSTFALLSESIKLSTSSTFSFAGSLARLKGLALNPVTLAIGATVLAISSFKKGLDNAQESIDEAAASAEDAVEKFNSMEETLQEINILIAGSFDSYEEYQKAIEDTSEDVVRLTEDQFDLAQQLSKTPQELRDVAEAVFEVEQALEQANEEWFIFRNLVDFSEIEADAVSDIAGATDSVEEFRLGLLRLRQEFEEQDKIDEFGSAEAVREIVDELFRLDQSPEEILQFLRDFDIAFTSFVAGLDAIEQVQPFEEGLDFTVDATLDEFLELNPRALPLLQQILETSEQTIEPANELAEALNLIFDPDISEARFQGILNGLRNGLSPVQVARIVEGVDELSDKLTIGAGAVDEFSSAGRNIVELDFDGIAKSAFNLADALDALESAVTVDDTLEALNELAEASDELGRNLDLAALEALVGELDLFNQESIELAFNLGILNEEQVELLVSTGNLALEVENLTSLLANATLSSEQQAAALILLREGFVSTAEEAFNLVESNEAVVDAALDFRRAMISQAEGTAIATAAIIDQIEALDSLLKAQNEVIGNARDEAQGVIDDLFSGIGGSGGSATQAEDGVESLLDTTKETVGAFVDLIEQQQELIELQEDLEDAIAEGKSESTIERIQEKIDEARGATENWEEALLDLTISSGASIDQIIAIGVALGEFTEEQAKAALQTLAFTRGLESIANAYVENRIGAEEAVEAAEALRGQIEAGEDLDLSAFGLTIEEIDTATSIASLSNEIGNLSEEIGGLASSIRGEIAGVDGAFGELNRIFSQAILDLIAARGELTDEELLQLEVEFGLKIPEQADLESQVNEISNIIRLLFGTTIIDNVPVDIGLDLQEIVNVSEFVGQIQTAVDQGAEVEEAVELALKASVEFQLDDADTAQLIEQVVEDLANDPDASAISVVAGNLGDIDSIDIQVENNLDDVVRDLESISSTIETELTEETKQILFETNLETDVAPELEEISTTIEEIINSDPTITFDTTQLESAKDDVQSLLDLAVDVDRTITYNVEVEGAPPAGSDSTQSSTGTGQSAGGAFFHGGLVRGKKGRDNIWAKVSDYEYITPNYIVKQPGVLDALRKITRYGTRALGPMVSMYSDSQTTSPSFGGSESTAYHPYISHHSSSSSRVDNSRHRNTTLNVNISGKGDNSPGSSRAYAQIASAMNTIS